MLQSNQTDNITEKYIFASFLQCTKKVSTCTQRQIFKIKCATITKNVHKNGKFNPKQSHIYEEHMTNALILQQKKSQACKRYVWAQIDFLSYRIAEPYVIEPVKVTDTVSVLKPFTDIKNSRCSKSVKQVLRDRPGIFCI